MKILIFGIVRKGKREREEVSDLSKKYNLILVGSFYGFEDIILKAREEYVELCVISRGI